MNLRPTLTALGAGVTAFFLVAVAGIELLPFAFSAIVGLPVGLLAGGVVFVVVFAEYRFAGPVGQRLATGVAGFGFAVLALLVVRYANLGGLRLVLTTDLLVGISAVAAVVVYAGLWFREAYEHT